MKKTTVEVEGMRCGMCEAHVADVIRKSFPTRKITCSHGKKQAVILSETSLDADQLRKAIADCGYGVGKIEEEEYVKKGLFGLFR